MMTTVKYIGLSITFFIILMIVWFFGSFSLGFANNSIKYQLELWLLYFAVIVVHFLLSLFLHRKIFHKLFSSILFTLCGILYIAGAWYFYNYT